LKLRQVIFDKTFKIKNLGKFKYFLISLVARSSGRIYVSHHKYIVLDILAKVGLLVAKSYNKK